MLVAVDGGFGLYAPLRIWAAIRSRSCLSIPRVLNPAPCAMARSSAMDILDDEDGIVGCCSVGMEVERILSPLVSTSPPACGGIGVALSPPSPLAAASPP